MYRLLLGVLLILIGAVFSGLSMAQQADPDSQAEADAGPDPQTAEPVEAADAAQPSSEVFLPSEEISEDFAVSFPVDI